MTVRDPIGAFGVHQATIIDRTTDAMNRLYVLGDFSAALGGENIPLRGGSSPYPWATAQGEAEAEVTLTIKQYSLDAMKYLIGTNSSTPNYTEVTSGEDTAGDVSALTNFIGTSVFDAATGIATATRKSSSNPIFGNYIVKAVSATTVDVYLDNNLGGVAYVDEALKITASPLTITASTAVEIPGTNIELTGGSGTIGMTTGDIARFSARPYNNYNFEFKGTANLVRPYFKLRLFTEVIEGGSIRYIEFPRVQAGGFNISQAYKEFGEIENTMMIMNDANLGYAWKMGVINAA